MRANTLVLALAIIASPLRVAWAQSSPDDVARRALVEAADRARREGDHPHAVDLYVRAGQIRMSPSLRQLIALEHFELGRVVDAFDAAERCVTEAESDATLNNRERILEVCRRIVGELRGQVGRVTVRAPSPTPSMTRVLLRGEALDLSTGSASRTVLPGVVSVEATAEGRQGFHREVAVAPGANVEVNVELVAPRLPSPLPASAPSVVVAPPAPPVLSHPTTDAGSVVGPGLVAGAGVASLGVAAAYAMMSLDADAERRATCAAEPSACASFADDADKRLQAYALVSNVALGVGLASVTGAALWTVFGRSRGDERVRRLRAVTPWLLGGVALVSAGAAIGFAIQRSDAAAGRDACGSPSCGEASVRANDRFDRYSLATDVALGVGAAAVTGEVLWFLLVRGESALRALRSWRVTPAMGGLLLGGSF